MESTDGRKTKMREAGGQTGELNTGVGASKGASKQGNQVIKQGSSEREPNKNMTK